MSKAMSVAATSPTWDFSKGPDFCSLVTDDPVVKITKSGASPSRSVSRPRKNASRNTVDYRDPLTGWIHRAEGTLEMKGLHQYFRDPKVTNVQPQFGPVSYLDRNGNKRNAHLDARISYSTGAVIVVSFKPAEVATKTNHQDELQCIFEQLPDTICQAASLVTDRDLPDWAVINGRLFFTVLNDPTWLLLDEMSDSARELRQPTTIEDFCLPFGCVATTFRTAVKLIAMGLIEAEPGLINAGTMVRKAREVPNGVH